jgi:E3 ubiquitin-protein ligase RNF14
MAAASVGATLSRALETHSDPSPESLSKAPSSSSSRAAEAEASPVSTDGGAEEDVLDLDSPWVAAADAESRLEEAAMAAAAAALHLRAGNEADADEIRDNQQRQDDEVGLLNIKLENSFILSKMGRKVAMHSLNSDGRGANA